MKDSIKANLIVFLIIAVIAFTISSAFASLTITEDDDSYKLSSIENDSFEPAYIDEVPTIIPEVETNNTENSTNTTNGTYDTNDTWNETLFEDWEI
ncbi:hypothetical protein [uncultured Methanobrevibacter sp.]|uniref:hypothetical protein n=1 Tax=uncultured Methanobrevibacter sp. TaxID=253161 RepID=UPI002634F810|nr:hypothetical protein [uncultured Methanobrevibacter sp.]